MKLKLNGKDMASGIFLIVVALAGLYLNMDHSLGTARRMGPGYMPMLVFWIQAGLGLIVCLVALASGPDPLERWTGLDVGTLVGGILAGVIAWKISPSIWSFFGQTYNGVGLGILVGFTVMAFSAGWKILAIICASVCIFGLLLEQAGFFAALTGLIIASCLAEHTHTKRGVVGLTIFLLVLCYWVFIYELDIRVNLWPQV
ncbi:hypothetical protein EJV46_09115 [Roseococcus sp. SYP-B2431]|uniref:tripartite tricarboxylate transporter TctB family protein n=1 Tax=Roseococcus sp. SYP-B2431 TaxID=2496640 RepID=UPI001038F613|nr:tripartite tricarboxylate transporter TctB family protein [Roseococcus sp. SYP-B2431]TCH98724.1 hypothetical protein EJV46_09115 [Roseococcus sp. SYP-B2431]